MELTRRGFLTTLAGGMAGLSGHVLRTARAAAAPRNGKPDAGKPNILFIFIDDMGWKDVGFMGSKYYETPHVDKLASQGMVFTSAYANGPNCAPTRACLISGQYTPRHRVFTVTNSDRGPANQRKIIPIPTEKTLKSEVVSIAEALKPAGYVSASMGKWHLGDDPKMGPEGQGFDLNVGGSIWGHPKGYFSPYKNPKLSDGPKGEYLTDRLTDEAITFIRTNKARPWFLYLTHYAVHTPIQAKDDITAKYKDKPASNGQGNAKYAAMIESVDQGVGRLVKTLDELGLADNTVVVFFSDNGGVGGITSMAPLRGSKGMLYEGGVREPCAIRWAGVVEAGTKCDDPIIGIDFYPTLLEIAGAPKPARHILDGLSIVPLLKGAKTLGRKAIFWHFPAYLQGRADGARDPIFRTRPGGAVRMGDWKLHEYFEDGDLELYNLKDDIGEAKNLAGKMPAKVKELRDVMVAWRKDVKAPIPTEKNPQYDPSATAAGGGKKRKKNT